MRRSGLQATFSSQLTRRGLWKGMCNRHTYGTTGERIVLLLNIGSKGLGESVELKHGEYPHFKGLVGGTAILQQVSLCRWDGTSWGGDSH